MRDEIHATARAFDVLDIPYRQRDKGGEPLLARIYRPHGPGLFSAVLEVHGGAWTKNDRTANEGLACALAGQGILVCSIDFRMPPEAGYPAPQNDINFAIRWLKSRASQFSIDPAKLGGLGTSSGGHQIMLTAICPEMPLYSTLPGPDGVDATLAFVATGWPICDPLGRYNYAKAQGKDGLVDSHNRFWGTEVEMIEGSPQHILDEGRNQALPPTLIVHGTKDSNVSHKMSLKYAETYSCLGGDIAVHVYEDEPHAFTKEHPDGANTQDAIAKIAAFVKQHG